MKGKIAALGIIVVMFMMGIASSTFALNVNLANQKPDPVAPGNFVYLNVKISNPASSSVKNVNLEFEEDSYFKVAKGEDKVKSYGTIPGYTSDESGNYIVGKYKLLVDEEAPSGLNTVTFDVSTNQGDYTYKFDVLVNENNPILEFSTAEVPVAEPGKNAVLNFSLANVNNIRLNDVKVSLMLEDIEGEVLTVEDGSNEKVLGTIGANEETSVVFNLAVAPDAEAKQYLLPVKLSYEDSLGNNFTREIYTSMKVFSEPKLSLNLETQEIYKEGRGKVSLAISNPGTSGIKGVQLEALDSEKYEVIEGEHQYIGDLNPDDFQTLQYDLYLNSDENPNLKIKTVYYDSYNNKKEEIIEVPLRVYDDEELSKYGFVSAGGFSFTTIIGAIVILIVGFGIGKWRTSRKAKKKK